MFFQRGDDFIIVGFPLFTLGRNYEGSESEASGSFKAACVGLVRDHDDDLRVRNAAGRDVGGDSLEVRAASGEENAEIFHGMRIGLQPVMIIHQRSIAGIHA